MAYQDIAAEAVRRTQELGHENSGYGTGIRHIPVVGGAIDYGINGPQQVETGTAKTAQQKANDLAAALEAERLAKMRGVGGGGGAAAGVGGVNRAPQTSPTFTAQAPMISNPGISTQYIDPLRQQQLDQLEALKAAAAGTVPSAAELQSRDAASKAASQQYGLAAALQGGMSAGGALRQASQGAAQIQGEANTQGAILRAQEQARARDALTQALAGQRGQEQQLAQAQSDVKLQTDLANQRTKLQAMGLDNSSINALLDAQLRAMGYSNDMARSIIAANAANTEAQNDRNKMILNTGANILALGARGGAGGGGYVDPNAGSTGSGDSLMPLGF